MFATSINLNGNREADFFFMDLHKLTSVFSSPVAK